MEERLPEIDTPVLAAKKITDDLEGYKEWWFGCCIYREYGFPWVQHGDRNPVEFWMPLPEPPQL